MDESNQNRRDFFIDVSGLHSARKKASDVLRQIQDLDIINSVGDIYDKCNTIISAVSTLGIEVEGLGNNDDAFDGIVNSYDIIVDSNGDHTGVPYLISRMDMMRSQLSDMDSAIADEFNYLDEQDNDDEYFASDSALLDEVDPETASKFNALLSKPIDQWTDEDYVVYYSLPVSYKNFLNIEEKNDSNFDASAVERLNSLVSKPIEQWTDEDYALYYSLPDDYKSFMINPVENTSDGQDGNEWKWKPGGQKGTIWSSFYGGSAKHTKDHFGMFIGGVTTGTKLSYKDNNGNVVVLPRTQAMYKDENGKLVQGSISDALAGKSTTWYGRAPAYLMNKAKAGTDWLMTNTKTGQKLGAYKENHNNGNASKWSPDQMATNQYRVGQNWSYGSVSVAKGSIGVTDSVVGTDFNYSGENGSASGRIDLLYGSANAGFEVGPDHVVVSASAEASLLHGEVAGDVGYVYENDDSIFDGVTMLGAGGQLKGDVAKVYANGKFGAGVYRDNEGNLQVDAGVQASVGADLCSATASGEVTVAGMGLSGTATAKIGIGAQLNVGFEDGEFNLHLGAALGIGFELGISVDFSGAIQVVDNVWSEVCSWFD